MKLNKILMLLSFTIICWSMSYGQKLYTKTGSITFESNAEMELIGAQNDKVSCVIDQESGKMQWACLIKAFKFEKALMQEHFNENYMESEKYPKAVFTGAITNLNDLNWNTPGEYLIEVSGNLEIHGVKQNVKLPAKVEVMEDGTKVSSSFFVQTDDYDIEIPAVVRENIAKKIAVSVSADLQSL